MHKAAQALRRHAVEQEGQEKYRHADCKKTEQTEASLGRVTAANALVHGPVGPTTGGNACHYSYCSRYRRTTCSAIKLRRRVIRKSARPSANAARVLALSNSWSPVRSWTICTVTVV